MDAGGLAQMTFNNFHQNSTASFGSRGKGTHLRNITVPGSNNLAAPSVEGQQATTPRSARSQLLAGLRTTPRPSNPTPSAAMGVDAGIDSPRHPPGPQYTGFTQQGAGSQQQQQQQQQHQQQHQQQRRLPTPPSVVSPATHVSDGEFDELDYTQLMTHNIYLGQQIAAAQKVQQLQHQLAQLQMQSALAYTSTPPMSPGMSTRNPAMYLHYGPYQQYVPVQNAGGYPQQLNQQYHQPAQVEISPPTPQADQPPSAGLAAHRQHSRSRSPPKLNLQSSNSANNAAFRRGHRKASSLSTCTTINNLDIAEAPKTSVPKVSVPQTPMTGTFGPGHASGTHPIRQPRGPPGIDELKAKPTANIEGSQNFAIRQRRRAIHKLVSAGNERRSNRSVSGSAAGTMTPVSENEGFAFEDVESTGSTPALSGRHSRQSFREVDVSNSSADEGSASRRGARSGLRAPSLVLSSAEKRKSALF